MKKIGLALGGGGARGCAHVGVIRALQKAGIKIDCVAGTSMGALVGGIFATGGIEEFEKYLHQIRWKDVLKQFDPVLMKNGLFAGKKVLKLLDLFLQKKLIEECPIPYTSVAVDLITGKEVHVNKGPINEAIRASISLPGIFTTVKKEGMELMDGGVINPLPINVVRQMGADVVIGVDLNHMYIRERKRQKIKRKKTRAKLTKGIFLEYPNIIDVIEGSVFLMQDQITQKNLEDYPPDLLLNLDLGSSSLFDFHKAKELIKLGEAQMKTRIPELQKIISS